MGSQASSIYTSCWTHCHRWIRWNDNDEGGTEKESETGWQVSLGGVGLSIYRTYNSEWYQAAFPCSHMHCSAYLCFPQLISIWFSSVLGVCGMSDQLDLSFRYQYNFRMSLRIFGYILAETTSRDEVVHLPLWSDATQSMRVLCVAEKPSIARSITDILSGGRFETVSILEIPFLQSCRLKLHFRIGSAAQATIPLITRRQTRLSLSHMLRVILLNSISPKHTANGTPVIRSSCSTRLWR
jgi:hypothetical protein